MLVWKRYHTPSGQLMKKFGSCLAVILLKLLSLLPFWALYIFSDILSLLLYYVFKYRRRIVLENLTNAFPEKTGSEINEIARKYYQHLADLLVESIKLISVSSKNLEKRYLFNGLDHITKHLRNNQRVVAVSGHYGNWEAAAVAIGSKLGNQAIIAYKPLTNKIFDKMMLSLRSRFGACLIPMNQTLRSVVSMKGKPFVLALIGDQTPSKDQAHHFFKFLNQPTAIFLGVEKISKMLNCPVVFFSIHRVRRGFYECRIEPLVDQPNSTSEFEITKLHTARLEEVIENRPEFWLWSHRRWKISPPKDHDPVY